MEAVEEAAAWLEEAWERRSGWNAAMAPLVIRDYGQRVLKSTGSLRLESGGRRRGRRGCEGGVGSGGKGPGDRWSHVLLVSASRRVTALLWPPRATPVYLLYFSDMKYIPSIAQHESGMRIYAVNMLERSKYQPKTHLQRRALGREMLIVYRKLLIYSRVQHPDSESD